MQQLTIYFAHARESHVDEIAADILAFFAKHNI